MSNDDRAATAPTTPSGRYRLRTHDLAPVLLPKTRTRAFSTADGSKVEEFKAVVPVRPRISITGVTRRGRVVLESVAFDPFSNSESFKLLLQNPEASAKRREDPDAVSEFQQWVLQHFPQFIETLDALRMIPAPHNCHLLHSPTRNDEVCNQFSCKQGHSDEAEEGEEKVGYGNRGEDSDEPWRLILRHATVRSAMPGEIIGSQSVTRSTCVYFLLNGHCTLSFRPMLLRDAKAPATPSILPTMSATMMGCSDGPVIQLRELGSGDCFGLDAASFGFNHLLTTAIAGTARQRTFLGLREAAFTYVLCLPYPIVHQLQLLQRRRQDGVDQLPPAFPYSFASEAEMFLHNTFLFQAMTDSSRRFLAAHMRPVVIARQEYLFTPGQPVQVFIVIAGQLTLGAPREEHAGRLEEADLELELLQAHDSVGLSEALHMTASFERYCVVTSASGARAYALSSTVLLMILAQEPISLKLIYEWITNRKSWFELRRATALAQRKKHTTDGSEHVVRLTLAAQRRSKLACSRCGWAGHASTSASCVRVEIPETNSADSSILTSPRRGGRSREGNPGETEQERGSRSDRCTDTRKSIPTHPPILPTSPDSSPRTPAHRKLQVDSMALRALHISKVPVGQRFHPSESSDIGGTSQNDQSPNSRATHNHSDKDDAMRKCSLAQSLQRLEAALVHKGLPGQQQKR
ncbi:unnamed protein product [Phytophthora fragariaefolia]|uniref:Unnamed protein product n=1 Tax=Phytophthora fragariaefolia TaxID=1490495 RepID=A0A9W6XWY3_9STRA|nr:unnamed protein product [Phytophthora fragariaefolia]